MDEMTQEEKRAELARNLRYKRPALRCAGYNEISNTLSMIINECDEVIYSVDDWELVANLIGDDEESHEFRALFTAVAVDAERLWENLEDCVSIQANFGLEFDDCTVALLGECQNMSIGEPLSGYDEYECDYLALTGFEADLAHDLATRKMAKLTKVKLIELIGRSVRILVAFLDLRQRYDYLKASMDVLRGENMAQLRAAQEINELYVAANAVNFDPWNKATQQLNAAIAKMPQRVFVE